MGMVGISHSGGDCVYGKVGRLQKLGRYAHSFLYYRLMYGDAGVFFEQSVQVIGMVSKLARNERVVDVLIVILVDVEHYFLNCGGEFVGGEVVLLSDEAKNIL